MITIELDNDILISNKEGKGKKKGIGNRKKKEGNKKE